MLGVAHGYDAIPEQFKSGIPAIAEEKFSYTEYSFQSIVAENLEMAVDAAQRNGGTLDGNTLRVPIQAAVPAEVELFHDYGSVKERIKPGDERMKLIGDWEQQERKRGSGTLRWTYSETAGSVVEVDFEGTGVIVTALHEPESGIVRVWLDGEDQGVYDSSSEEDPDFPWGAKSAESVFHRFGLEDGPHNLRVEVLGEPYVRSDFTSTSSGFSFEDVVIFQ